MLRFLWYLGNVLVFTVIYGVWAITAAMVGISSQRGLYDRLGRGWSRKLLKAAGVPVMVVGREKVPVGQPVVFVSNHQSFFDILVLASHIPGGFRFVAKKELTRIPIFGKAMRSAGHIVIDRQNRQQAFGAYDEAARAVRAGMNAVVFAEGTRSRTGRLLPFKKGPFVLAIAAQVPVVPVYCSGTFQILPKGTIRIRPRTVELRFGEPIPTRGMDYEDRERLMQRARAAMEQLRIDAGIDER